MERNKRITNYFHLGDDMSRIVALSDGLFATVLTILVLDLRPNFPTTLPSHDITGYLLVMWPNLFNFMLTFIVAGLFWIGHHWDFEHIVVYDRRLLWLNLMFLLSIVLLPFTTSLLGITNIDISIRWDIYASVIILISLTMIVLWEYSSAHQLIDPHLDPKLVTYVRVRNGIPPLVFLLTILFVPVLSNLVFYFPLLIVPMHLIASRVFMSNKQSGSPKDMDHDKEFWKTMLWQVLSYLPLVVFLILTLWIKLASGK